MYLLGFDIGGTKCAVVTAVWDGENISILQNEKCSTDFSIAPQEMISKLISLADGILEQKPDRIGISCGGPLDSSRGIILGPPNLPGWDHVAIVEQLEQHYGVHAKLQNDANACAVAEWKFGAGKGCRNMVFMTFGTGLGAGFILDGKLYSGTNGNAGELGHIRLSEFGPVGFGKAGSFEGFCSGNGIAQLGYFKALEKIQQGEYPLYFQKGDPISNITAKSIADAARAGDETAIDVYRTCGAYLGKGLAMIIDLLNPEKIVIGSIFSRSRDLLWESTEEVVKEEALMQSASCCEIVPAELGEQIGDYAAIAVALS